MEITTKIKTSLSAIIVIIALTLVVFAPVGLTYADGNIGIILDFGEEKTYYGIIDDMEDPNAYEALDRVCDIYNFKSERDGNVVISIDNIESGTDGKNWGLYVVETSDSKSQNKYSWVKVDCDPNDVQITHYAAVAWAFCSESDTPSKAVDTTGRIFYGYGHPEEIVSLSPSCTEMICAVGGERKIIGTDDFSNYPKTVELSRESGNIVSIGGFTNPNYETIISLAPDLVICINSQYSHIDMAKKLRAVGINVLVIDGGENVGMILESLMMVGTAMGIRDTADDIVNNIYEDLAVIREKVEFNSSAPKNAMVALSTDRSPWISGSNTYASDILERILVENVFKKQEGWVMINSEYLVPKNPEDPRYEDSISRIDYVVVVFKEGPKTQDEYEFVLSLLGSEWTQTDAYKNGNVYFLTDSAADLASRPGPRVAQFNELIARIIQNTAFDEDIPKFIGDEYKDYLLLTKDPVVDGFL